MAATSKAPEPPKSGQLPEKACAAAAKAPPMTPARDAVATSEQGALTRRARRTPPNKAQARTQKLAGKLEPK